jgi:hypothetical protein
MASPMRTVPTKHSTLTMALAATLFIMRIAQCSAASGTAPRPAATLNRQDDIKHTLNSATHSTAQHHGDFVLLRLSWQRQELQHHHPGNTSRPSVFHTWLDITQRSGNQHWSICKHTDTPQRGRRASQLPGPRGHFERDDSHQELIAAHPRCHGHPQSNIRQPLEPPSKVERCQAHPVLGPVHAGSDTYRHPQIVCCHIYPVLCSTPSHTPPSHTPPCRQLHTLVGYKAGGEGAHLPRAPLRYAHPIQGSSAVGEGTPLLLESDGSDVRRGCARSERDPLLAHQETLLASGQTDRPIHHLLVHDLALETRSVLRCTKRIVLRHQTWDPLS